MMKKVLKTILHCVPIFVLWGFICLFIYNIMQVTDLFLDLDYVYGKHIYTIIYIVGALVLLSVVYLRLFIKREIYIQVSSLTLTFVFFISIYIMNLHCDEVFRKFTTEKFIEHPNKRLLMYFDLLENYDIKGYSYEDIEKLLGKPDAIIKDKYIYADKYHNCVNVVFKNGKAVTFQCAE